MAPQPPPAPVGRGLRAALEVRSAPRRWPGALRAGLCMGIPVLVGWSVGDLGGGLTATLGSFTALYGSGRPYLNRAVLLAVVALSLSAAVGLGIWAASVTWLGVLTVAAIATLATLLCNALEVGPPGAYQFALVCAAGMGLHAGHQDPVRSALLVLAGGAFAWLAHMAGAVFARHTPERSAVAIGGSAVANYIDAIATDREEAIAGLACIASPILVNGRPVAAVSVAFPSGAGTGQQFENPLRQTTATIARALLSSSAARPFLP